MLTNKVIISIVVLGGLLGCGRTSNPRPEEPTIKEVPQTRLPIGDYLPPLDEDRIEIASPENWHVSDYDRKYLKRFFKTDQNGLPHIRVNVEQRRFGELETVSKDNLEQFAKLVAAEFEQRGTKLLEPVISMSIGDTPCARYVMAVRLKLGDGKPVMAERQSLLVLNDGRLYTIDLLVLPETLLESRDAAYAVCASFRFFDSSDHTTADSDFTFPEP